MFLVSDAIEVLKKRIIPEYQDKLYLAFQDEEKKVKEELQSLKKALLALEQKEKLPELLAEFVLTLYTPKEIELNNNIFGDTKKQFIKKAEVFLNGKKS